LDTKVNWKGKDLLFSGTGDSGNILDLAVSPEEGESGFEPMELLGIGLAGCTGMDVISILQKKRQDVTDFEVKVHTEKAENHPRVWTSVNIEYIVTGNNIDPKAVERAMFLSYERYCPAQNMIKKAVDIDMSYKIIETEAIL
jgi:putative redox protein